MKRKILKLLKLLQKVKHQQFTNLLIKLHCNQYVKKVIKVEGTTFNDYRNALKEFQILCYLNHPCICTAIGLNTSDVVKKKDR